MAFDEISPCDPEERGFEPPVDIWEDDDAFFVKVELPGVHPEDVVIDSDDELLSIAGVRHLEPRPGPCHRRERAYGAFCRRFALPDTVDGASAVAVIAEGVLTIRIPKREAPVSDVRRAS